MSTKKDWLLATLFLPVLVLGGNALWRGYQGTLSKSWQVRIEGYDPRSFFMGHYVQFKINWPVHEKSCQGPHCCLCLNKDEKGAALPVVSEISCLDSARTCESLVLLKNEETPEGYDLTAPQRYYVSEEVGRSLNETLRKGDAPVWLELIVSPQGRVRFGAYKVEAPETKKP